MSKKVEVNKEKVLELWSKGYNNVQVKATLGIKKSTWDRWYKEYKETPVETPVTPVETPVETETSQSSLGRGGVRYKYTDTEKYEQFRKDDALRIMEQYAKKQELTHKTPERSVKPEIPEELLQYDQTDVPYEVWTKYVDKSKGEHWGTFVMKYGRYLEPKKQNSASAIETNVNEKLGAEYFTHHFGNGGTYNPNRDSYILNGEEILF